MRNTRVSFLLAALLAAAAPAGPPLVTDDPETLEKGTFELNTTYRLTLSARNPGGAAGREWAHDLLNFDLAFGFLDGVQVKFEAPLEMLDPAGGMSARGGLGDASIGSKIRIVDEKDFPVAVSIYPAVGIPLGNRHQGLGNGSLSLTLPVLIGRHFLNDKLWVYADGGYVEDFARDGADEWYAGLAAEWEAAEGVTLVGEVHRDFGVRGSADDALCNVGVKWKLTGHAAFIGALGRSFNPTANSGADLLLNIGVQWSF
jgi:hypothetical protein